MAAFIVAELLLIALFIFWPQRGVQIHSNFTYQPNESFQIQAPVRTEQESSPPPPPTPQVPIPVPNDQPIKPEVKIPHDIASNAIDSLSLTPGTGGQGKDAISGNPQVGPRVVKIEEPTFENKTDQKVDIYVRFLVDKKGRVEHANIEKMLLYDKHGQATIPVKTLQNKMIVPQTIKAALNWKFRPAKDHGKPVRAYTRNIFTIDY